LSLKSFARLALHTQLLPVLESGEETLVGGQAVMEGVMMRAPHSYCVAVRKPSGEIVTEESPLPRVSEKYPIFKLPVLRGIGTLGQAMWLGVKALKFSANAALDDGEKPEEVSSWMMTLNMVFSFAFFVFLYKFVPLYLATLLRRNFPVLDGRVAFNAVDGVIRMVIFLGFLYLLSRLKDIHAVFQYHGAEHKVVFNFESGKDVNVQNAQSFTTLHPRCGTSFLLVVMVLSMLVYMLLPFDSFVGKFLARIALLPVIAGLSYELIRFAAKHQGSVFAMLTTPGLWLQRITTQPPSDTQTQVAIHALEGAMNLEKAQGGELVIA
jgi:Predicted metal-dependent enzyme